tara:strand:- start:448 stop:948 length:501 start_codon:yes stop_codon:yes gene_type:complete
MSFKLVESKKKEEDQKFISCKDFFKNIRYEKDSSSPIRFDMDNFMLCLILGLKLDRKENYDDFHFQQEFSSKYIDSYSKTKDLITGLLLSKIMKSKKIDKNEKTKVKNLLKEVLDTNDDIYIKKEYVNLIHEYYLGGYCALLKEFDNKEPNEVSIFFNKYNKLIKD